MNCYNFAFTNANSRNDEIDITLLNILLQKNPRECTKIALSLAKLLRTQGYVGF